MGDQIFVPDYRIFEPNLALFQPQPPQPEVLAPAIIIPKAKGLPPSASTVTLGALVIPKGRDHGVQLLVDHLDGHAKKYMLDGSWDQMGPDERFQTLKKAEREAILEQARICRQDFIYTARNYFWITNDQGHDQLFTLWESQWLVLEKWMELKRKGRAQKVMVLKGRQLGVSLLLEAMIAWRTMFFRNTEAIVVSVDEEQSSYLYGLMLHFYDKMPWWLKPEAASLGIKDGLHFDRKDRAMRERNPGMNSHIYVQHANQLSGVGQGKRLSACHVCFAPETIIHLAGGEVKPITEIVEGDRVITSAGVPATIKKLWKSDRHNELTTDLYLWGNPFPLSTTRDHRILTPSGFKEARHIQKGEYVCAPVRRISHGKTGFDVVVNGLGGSGHSRANRSTIKTHPCSYDWGWLFGLYLAEGTIQRNDRLVGENKWAQITFGIHRKEEAEFSWKLRRALGEDHHIGISRHTSLTSVVRIGESSLARFVKREFGYSSEKTIPEWVWDSGEDFCKGVVHGYLEGDGHLRPGIVRASSIRPAITFQMRSLVASLGMGWCGVLFRESGEFYGRNCKAIWTLSANGSTANAILKSMDLPCAEGGRLDVEKWRYSEDRRFVKIEVDTSTDGYSKEFYDLEVDAPEHDFTTIHCCVANSEYTDFQQAKAKEIIEGDLLHSIHDNDPNSFGFLESTGRGAGSYSHMLWKANIRMGEDAEWYPLFLPFFLERSRVVAPPQGWHAEKPERQLRERVAAEWVKCDSCDQYHVAKFGGESRIGAVCPACDKGTLHPARLSDDQLRWKELKRRNAEAKDKESLKLHHQETAATAEDSWQLSGYAVFDEICQDAMALTVRDPIHSPDVKVGFLDSRGRFHGVKFERNKDGEKELKIGCFVDGCTADHRTSQLYEDESCFIVWEDPIPGYAYAIGVDISEGIGEDYSVIAVNKLGKGAAPDEQVAAYRTNTVEPLDLAFFANAIGRMYNEALMCIEYNFMRAMADEVRFRYQYPNLFRWKHPDHENIRSGTFHWFTNFNTKSKLWQTARKWIKANAYIVRSPTFVEETQTFQKDDDEDRAASHSKGSHDDCLIAFMIALYCSHEAEADDTGRISVPAEVVQTEPPRYEMKCKTCGCTWGCANPETEFRCPQEDCGSIFLTGRPLEMPDPRATLDIDALLGVKTGPKGESLPPYAGYDARVIGHSHPEGLRDRRQAPGETRQSFWGK